MAGISTSIGDGFAHVTDWVFDLDNTLYPRHCDLFEQIDWKMTDYVAGHLDIPKDQARVLQKEMYHQYGTTLRGLMLRYQVDPSHFIEKVHDIDYSPIDPNPLLGELIAALPGRKHVFTNGDTGHAERTLARLGIGDLFFDIFDIVAADLIPKPAEQPYLKFLTSHNVDPVQAVMFEDMPRNLDVPKQMGMGTVLVLPAKGSKFHAENWEHDIGDGTSIDHVTHDLDVFLGETVLRIDAET